MVSPLDLKMVQFSEGEVQNSIRRVVNSFNATIYAFANEPSLGMYRIQEHISIAVPRVVGQKQTLEIVNKQVEGASFDIEYDTRAVRDMQKSIKAFESVNDNLRRAIETKLKMDEAAALARSIQSPQTKESPPPPQRRNYGSVAKSATPIFTNNQAQEALPEVAEQQKARTQTSGTDLFLKPKTFT